MHCTGSSEVGPHKYSQLYQGAEVMQWHKDGLFNNGAGTTRNPYVKTEPRHRPYTFY